MQSFPLFVFLGLIPTLLLGEEIDVSQPLRIDQLFPLEVDRPPIDPALPENFIGINISTEGKISPHLWGPPDQIEAFLRGEPITSPLFKCTTVPFFCLRMPDVKSLGPDASFETGQWGESPYSRIFYTKNEVPYYLGFIAAKEPKTSMFMLQLYVPLGKEKEGHELWNTFFQNTKPLPLPLKMKTRGQEMHIGYTILNIGPHSIRVSVQKRKKDHKIRYALFPQDQEVGCEIFNKAFSYMENEWHRGHPLFKLDGCYSVENVALQRTVFVLIEEVDEFSPLPPIPKNGLVKTVRLVKKPPAGGAHASSLK